MKQFDCQAFNFESTLEKLFVEIIISNIFTVLLTTDLWLHWKKQCVTHYVNIVLTLWRNSGIILELSLPQFCYTSRVLSQCGIIS